MSKASVFLALIAAILAVTSAVSDAEREAIRADSISLLASCSEELVISKEEVLAAKEAKNIDGVDSCLFACLLKKLGVINDSGVFDIESAKKKNSKYFSSEEDRKMANDAATTCLSVNEATVTDGDKGCERAKLLISCFVKEAPDVLF